MSKAKVFGFVVVLVIAILITFFITRNASTYSCGEKDKKSIPEEDAPKHPESHRLPTNVLPVSYEIKLQPFVGPSEFHFNGSVSILVNVKAATDVVQLNAFQIEIPEQQVVIRSVANNATVKVSSVELKDQFLTFKLSESLKQNEDYTLFIPFRGNLTKSLVGFYLSSYVDSNKNTRYIAMTHFEASQARRAFPCFDEPAMKATFELEMVHFKNMTALGNMPNTSVEAIDADWVRTKFEKSVKMSTYLVAFAVGEFDFSYTPTPTKPEYRVATKPGEKPNTEAAIEFGPAILAYYEDYFNYSFPLPKIDSLATPDFDAGAMENFGLITYRESMFLYDKNYGSAEYKFSVCQTIAHELAHQWSGNLVTPKFWDDLWLNEGFADYISYEGVNRVRPNWNVWDRFVIDEVQDVLAMDSLKSTHPISVKVNSPEEAEELFDLISYEKGASVIRMLANIIGRDAFRRGLHDYLEAFKFSNADQNDLWTYLQAASDKLNVSTRNLSQVMGSWTLQEGYPLVTVTRNYADQTVRFSQKRFLLNSENEQALLATQYEVPISYTTKTESDWTPSTKLWLKKKNGGESFEVKNLSIPEDEWIIVNLQETGYYRVTYDEKNWNLLVNQLLADHTAIHPINRAQILDDLFRLAENEVVSYELALRALQYLKKETKVLPWLSFEAFIGPITRKLGRTELFGDWKNFIRDLVRTTYEQISAKQLEDDDLENGRLQRVIVGIACEYELDSCITNSIDKFRQRPINPSSPNPVPPNIRGAVYCTGIAYGDKLAWDSLFAAYLREPNANERKEIIKALACTRAPWILTNYLKLAFNESSGVRTQDVVFLFRAFKTSNFEYGRDVVFSYLMENWEVIHQIHGEFKTFGEIVDSFDSLSTRTELAALENLYRTMGHRIGRSKRSFLQTLDKIAANMRWMERNLNEIAAFLNKRKPSL